jgi:hypothetical protein
MNKLIHGTRHNAIQTEKVVKYTEVTLMKLLEMNEVLPII